MAFYAIHLGIFKAGVFGDSRGQVGFGEIGSKKRDGAEVGLAKNATNQGCEAHASFFTFCLVKTSPSHFGSAERNIFQIGVTKIGFF